MTAIDLESAMIFDEAVTKIARSLVASNVAAVELEVRVLFVEDDELKLYMLSIFWPAIKHAL